VRTPHKTLFVRQLYEKIAQNSVQHKIQLYPKWIDLFLPPCMSEYNAHCKSCDLTTPNQSHTQSKKHNMLTASHKRLNTILPQNPQKPMKNHIVCFLETDKTWVVIFDMLQLGASNDLSKISWVWKFGLQCYGLERIGTGFPPTLVQLFVGEFAKELVIHFYRKVKEREERPT